LKKVTLEKAKELLQNGDVVAIPTETVYGLAGWIYSEAGLKKIFSTKERPFFDPLIVHVDSIEKALPLTRNWTHAHEVLARACWPGPLTLIAEKSEKINPLITSGLDSVGLRCPRHELTLQLLSQIDGGLAAPSANKFGKTSPTTARHVEEEFGDQVPVIDGGPSDIGIESTVVGVAETSGHFHISIYRPGFFTAKQLETTLTEAGLSCSVSYTQSPVAPGQLKHHYMPRIPLVIVPEHFQWEIHSNRIESQLNHKFSHPIRWKLPEDPVLASRTLYEDLRSFDQKGFDLILISKLPSHQSEDWLGIWNRLEKAQTLTLSL
jgi:L-threonylcarbamoyladenylate synthase